ncbi:TPA: hypothetical protein ACH3X2_010562 [Trebouxia sp. C0005]
MLQIPCADLLVLSRRVHPDQRRCGVPSPPFRCAQLKRDFAGVWICKPASLMMAICLARFNRARVVVPNAPLSFKAVIMCWVMT